MTKVKPFIKLFQTPGGHYVYDVNTNAIIKIRKSLYDFLMSEQKSKMDVKECFITSEDKELLEKMRNIGFFSSKKVREISHIEDHVLEYHLDNKLKMIVLQVTQNCNLRCHYCAYSGNYLNRKHTDIRMDFDTARKGIDFLIRNSRDVNNIRVGFYGGEPLLEFGLVKKCIDYTIEATEGKTVNFNLTSNGTLFTKEIIEFFMQHDVEITISLDGPKEIHDKNRKFVVSGCGTFDKVSKNLEFFKENYPEYFKKVMFNTVLDNKNDFNCVNEFFASYDIIKNSFVTSNEISPIYAKVKSELCEEYEIKKSYEQFKIFLNKVNRLDECYVSKLLKSDYDRLKQNMSKERKHTKELPDKSHHGGPCVPGTHRLFMDVNGNFYPCEKASEDSDIMRIGHVDRGFDIEKVRALLNIGRLTKEKCIDCWAFRFCIMCAVFADDKIRLSAEKKQSNCNAVRNMQEANLKDYCTFIEFGHDFRENDIYFEMEE